MKKVIVTVDPKGGTTIQAVGFTGPSCTDITKIFAQGLKEVQEAKTADYYSGGEEQQSISVGA